MTQITNRNTNLIEDDDGVKKFNMNNIKLARYLGMLDEKQMDDLISIAGDINYKDVISIIQLADKEKKSRKIKDLLLRFRNV